MKFSALNVDFNGPFLDCLCSRRPVYKGIKEGCLFKMCAFGLLNGSKTINTGFHNHHRVECRLLRSVSLDWFAVVLHTCTTVTRSFFISWAFSFLVAIVPVIYMGDNENQSQNELCWLFSDFRLDLLFQSSVVKMLFFLL